MLFFKLSCGHNPAWFSALCYYYSKGFSHFYNSRGFWSVLNGFLVIKIALLVFTKLLGSCGSGKRNLSSCPDLVGFRDLSMFSIPQYDVRVEDSFQGKLWDEDVFGQFSFWEWQKVIEQISSFRTRFQHHILTDNQDWLVEGGAGGTERGIFSKEMSTPCPKPLQPKSSPEDGQNLAEVWAVSSFSSPWFLTSLSESQLQFNRDLLQARGKFYQYQEESNSLTSLEPCSLSQWSDNGPAKSQESRPGFFLSYHDPTWQSSQGDGKRTQILPQTVATERMDLSGDLWSKLSAETLPRELSLGAQVLSHLHRHFAWITKGKTGWYNSVFPVWKWMSVLLHMDIILFSMCFPFIPVLTPRLHIAGGCRRKGRREKRTRVKFNKNNMSVQSSSSGNESVWILLCEGGHRAGSEEHMVPIRQQTYS